MKAITFTLAAASLALVSYSASSADENSQVRLATTTSTYHSGLLDYLLPEFEKDTGYKVNVIATGTGKALKMGENGDVDLVMTHAPKAEANFVEQGYGMEPRKLMYNDFVIVGPKADPAKIADSKEIAQVFKKIADMNATFISRGDDSGTHKKEKGIWAQTKMEPNFGGYRSVGQGMGPTLNMANEMQGYTMTDRGTWLAYNNKLDLEVLFQCFASPPPLTKFAILKSLYSSIGCASTSMPIASISISSSLPATLLDEGTLVKKQKVMKRI